MSIYTQVEMFDKKINANYAATAARFIMEIKNKDKQVIWPNCKVLKPYNNKLVTFAELNQLTQQIIADTKY
jgi:hypothetical protein